MPEVTSALATSTQPAKGHAAPEADTELDCTVVLSRMHPDDCGQRQVFARLDDGPSVTLLFGESVTLDVQPGSHRLRVHNTLFWKRLAFSIEPGERLEFVIINGARWWTAGMAGMLGWAPIFLTVRKQSLQ